MNKLDYFISSVHKEDYVRRAWLLSSFGILPDGFVNEYYKIDKKKIFIKVMKEDKEEFEEIEGFKLGQPLFDKDELVTLPKNIIPFIEEKMETTYGIFIINLILFWFPYKGKVKYINGKIEAKTVNGVGFELLKNNKSTVEEHIKFENAANMITCLSQVGVPAASRRSITPNPKIKEFKRKLLQENKDKLNDPAVIVQIQNEIVKMDKEYLKGDTSMGFFIQSKNFNVHRLKLMGMYGAEPDFYNENKLNLMDTSLSEGWNKDHMMLLFNQLRAGIYARGKDTALGGVSTKITTRIFQNYRIENDDCLATEGLHIRLTENNYKTYVGRSIVGRKSPLEEDELKTKAKKNDVIEIRSPAYCKSPGTTYCKKCLGDNVLISGMGLNAQCVITTSNFMSVAMAAMHSKELKIGRYSFKDRIS